MANHYQLWRKWISLLVLVAGAVIVTQRLQRPLATNINNVTHLIRYLSFGNEASLHHSTCPRGIVAERLWNRLNVLRVPAPSEVEWESCNESSQIAADLFYLIDYAWYQWHIANVSAARITWKRTLHREPKALQFLAYSVGQPDHYYTLSDTQATWRMLHEIGKAAVEAARENTDIYLLLREIASEKLRDPDTGIAWLETAQDRSGSNWTTNWLLYGDSISVGNYEQAQVYLERAKAQDERYEQRSRTEYLWRLGAIELRQKDPRAAARWLESCLEIDVDNQLCLFYVGEAYFQLQDYNNSFDAFSSLEYSELSPSQRQFTAQRLEELARLVQHAPGN